MITSTVKSRVKLILILIVLFQLIVIGVSQAQTTRTVETGEFHTIYLNSDYDISLRQSNTTEVKAKADPEIWDATNIWVDNGVLHVDVKAREGSKKSLLNKIENRLTATMELSITTTNVRKIVVNGNGNVTAENSLSPGQLSLEMNGNGRITLDSRSSRVTARVYSEGEIEITGYADLLDLHVSGGGTFNGANFDAKTINAEIRGPETSCTINSSETINIDVYGPSEVFYRGKAGNINKHIYGSGSVLFRS